MNKPEHEREKLANTDPGRPIPPHRSGGATNAVYEARRDFAEVMAKHGPLLSGVIRDTLVPLATKPVAPPVEDDAVERLTEIVERLKANRRVGPHLDSEGYAMRLVRNDDLVWLVENASLPKADAGTDVERMRAAFEAYRRRPFVERLGACPDSFELSPTGQMYAVAHVEADFRQFAAGYRAALTPSPPAENEDGWRAGGAEVFAGTTFETRSERAARELAALSPKHVEGEEEEGAGDPVGEAAR